jgi:hypothetical protein
LVFKKVMRTEKVGRGQSRAREETAGWEEDADLKPTGWPTQEFQEALEFHGITAGKVKTMVDGSVPLRSASCHSSLPTPGRRLSGSSLEKLSSPRGDKSPPPKPISF